MSKMLPTELMSASMVTYKGKLFDGVVNLLYIKVYPLTIVDYVFGECLESASFVDFRNE